jgi:S-adenosylmethionine:tRNA ribosyltransferase-isomerase
MHEEAFHLGAGASKEINAASRVVPVGTTVTRVLKHLGQSRPLTAASACADIFIYPPYQFKVIDALLTNFHLPKSTLLMLE